MADMNRGNRPLSPFMLGPYYRPQLNSVTSILNRISGIALLGSAFLLVWWLLALATGPDAFRVADALMTSILGDLVFTISILGLWYHALGGVRHLIWDAGYGLDMATADRMGWGVIIGAFALTFLTIVAI
ncbi:succinate dehydrogenase, cytochrome b556 subunit [Rhodobacterales bacterium HKCCE2091]|nr:succinate dehydrogenase, cytochrome b556 subunit [Rhodobacterales bacterium HKCCE2091]